jgi:hypothetical protein
MSKFSETRIVAELHEVNGETDLKLIGKAAQLRNAFGI